MGGLAHKDGHIIFVEAKKMLSQDYYFISTSGPSDVQSRVGGFCQSHNMKVVFKVLDPEMVAAAVEAAKSVERVNLDLEVIRINSEIKPIVSTKTSEKTTERADRERRRKRKRKEKEESFKSTTKPSELQKFLAKRGFSSSSSRGPVSPKALILLFILLLLPQHQHITQLFPFLPR